MSNITTQFSHKILNYLFGRVLYTNIAAYYMGVSTTPIGTDGTDATEPVGGGYARLMIPNDRTSFSAATNKKVGLVKQFQFPESIDDDAGERGMST